MVIVVYENVVYDVVWMCDDVWVFMVSVDCVVVMFDVEMGWMLVKMMGYGVSVKVVVMVLM